MVATDKIEDILDMCNMTYVSGPDADCKMGYNGACNFFIRVAPQFHSVDDFKAFIDDEIDKIISKYGKGSDYVRGYIKACKDILNLFK